MRDKLLNRCIAIFLIGTIIDVVYVKSNTPSWVQALVMIPTIVALIIFISRVIRFSFLQKDIDEYMEVGYPDMMDGIRAKFDKQLINLNAVKEKYQKAMETGNQMEREYAKAQIDELNKVISAVQDNINFYTKASKISQE